MVKIKIEYCWDEKLLFLSICFKENYKQYSYIIFDCHIYHKWLNHQRKMQYQVKAMQLKTMLMPLLKMTWTDISLSHQLYRSVFTMDSTEKHCLLRHVSKLLMIFLRFLTINFYHHFQTAYCYLFTSLYQNWNMFLILLIQLWTEYIKLSIF